MDVDPRLSGWLFVLLGSCGLYARWLHSLKRRYEPDWTIFTVIAGNALICAAIFGMEWVGFAAPGTGWLVVWCNVAAGFPIAVWQLVQYAERRGRNGTH